MDPLRRAAEQALSLGVESPESRLYAGEITRVTVDVEAGSQAEMVSLRMRDGRLTLSCTCGDTSCPHSIAALRFVTGQSAERSDPSVRTSRGTAERLVAHSDAQAHELAEVLDDVVTDIARAGVAAESGVSITATLDRLLTVVGTPTPLGVMRWVGRLQRALDTRDVTLAAHALAGATRLAADLRAGSQNPDALAQITTWLGVTAGDDRVITRASDRTWIELAREWLPGIDRAQIERRYLIDLHSGERYREERVRRATSASIGPCPRSIEVGFAEIEIGAAPRRARVLQYTTTPVIDPITWKQVSSWAERDFASLRERYRRDLGTFGALSEPFVLVAPTSLRQDAMLGLVDEHGHVLPVVQDDDAGSFRRFEDLAVATLPTWVAGRLLDREDRVVLRPLAAGILKGETLVYERL